MTFTIRPLAPTGEPPALLDRLGAVVVDAYRAIGALERDDGYEPVLRDVAGRARDAVVLAALADDGAALGCITYVPGPDNPLAEHLAADEASLRMLAVAAAAQGRGVGGALIAACLDRARADGRAAVFLHSLPVMTAAQRLYARAGFRPVPDRDWFVDGLHLQGFRLALI